MMSDGHLHMTVYFNVRNLKMELDHFTFSQLMISRNITMDNLYSSYKLAKQMLPDFGATMTGTMRMNRK